MDKLKKVIVEYPRWAKLSDYIDRIESFEAYDFSMIVEIAKSLLETIALEICKLTKFELKKERSNIKGLLKCAIKAIGNRKDSAVFNQISSALETIGQNIGELRNQIGITAHGKTLEKLGDRNRGYDNFSKEFLLDSTDIVASFLIRIFESTHIEKNKIEEQEISFESLNYRDNEGFNEFFDNLYDEFKMGDYSYTASEILFYVDSKAYEVELKNYLEGENGAND